MASKQFGVDIEMLGSNEHINLRVDTLDVTTVTAVGNSKRIVYWNGDYYYSNNVIWIKFNSSAVLTISGYYKQAFVSQTSVTITHGFGAEPLVQLLDASGKEFIPLAVTHNSVNDFTVTFSILTTGTIIASIGAPNTSYVIKSGAYVVTSADQTIEVTTAGATQTLPTAVGKLGKTFRVINCSGGIVRVDTTSSQTIGNAVAGNPTYIDLNPEEWLDVISNNVNYRII
jgi:hypothetical protein